MHEILLKNVCGDRKILECPECKMLADRWTFVRQWYPIVMDKTSQNANNQTYTHSTHLEEKEH